MGQIIRLPVALTAEYPDTPSSLEPASLTLLNAIRWWLIDFQEREDPLQRLLPQLDNVGAHDAAFSVDRLMAIIVHAAWRPMSIHAPGCPQISADEKLLLNAARLVQDGQALVAERALRLILLSAQGAQFALGPLQGLGDLFAEARLFFARRQPSIPDSVFFDDGDASRSLLPPRSFR